MHSQEVSGGKDDTMLRLGEGRVRLTPSLSPFALPVAGEERVLIRDVVIFFVSVTLVTSQPPACMSNCRKMTFGLI